MLALGMRAVHGLLRFSALGGMRILASYSLICASLEVDYVGNDTSGM